RVKARVGSWQRRRHDLCGDVTAGVTAPGLLQGFPVGGVHDRPATGDVVQRFDDGADVHVPQGAGPRVVDVGAQILVGDQRVLHGRSQADTGKIDVHFPVDEPLVDLVLVDADVHFHPILQGRACGVGPGVPLLVAFEVQTVTGPVLAVAF